VKEDRLMEKDVVCGMQVDTAKAAGTSEYNGNTYYFCSKGCKAKFDANPGQFVKVVKRQSSAASQLKPWLKRCPSRDV
jgi:YHS domain-containing protein